MTSGEKTRYGYLPGDEPEDKPQRVKIVSIDGADGFVVRFTSACSGCCEGVDGDLSAYPYDAKAHCHIGAGCEECGYTGKRRHAEWVPWNFDRARKAGL